MMMSMAVFCLDSKQLVVNMVFVGQKGILSVTYPVKIDAHHIEVRDDKR